MWPHPAFYVRTEIQIQNLMLIQVLLRTRQSPWPLVLNSLALKKKRVKYTNSEATLIYLYINAAGTH